LQNRFYSWVVKRATLLFNAFCSNVAKQVARFCRSFLFDCLESAFSLKIIIPASAIAENDVTSRLVCMDYMCSKKIKNEKRTKI